MELERQENVLVIGHQVGLEASLTHWVQLNHITLGNFALSVGLVMDMKFD
jgi:hypothetical protein